MNKVVGFIMVGTNDLKKSSKFYDAILAHLGLKKVTITERYIGYGHPNEDNEVISENIRFSLEIPNTDEHLAPFLMTIPLQLLAYHVASLKNCDIDKPRNLAKSVTVE